MKNLLLFIFSHVTFCSFAQVHSAMPPEAGSFYNKAMPSINPDIKILIEKNAVHLKSAQVDTDSLSYALKKDPLLKKMKQPDLDAIAVLILVQASKNADADLKTLVINMRKTNNQNTQKVDATVSLLEYKSKIAEGIPLLMKKISDSQESAINNLR